MDTLRFATAHEAKPTEVRAVSEIDVPPPGWAISTDILHAADLVELCFVDGKVVCDTVGEVYVCAVAIACIRARQLEYKSRVT